MLPVEIKEWRRKTAHSFVVTPLSHRPNSNEIGGLMGFRRRGDGRIQAAATNGNDHDLFGDASGHSTLVGDRSAHASYSLYGELGFQGSFCPEVLVRRCALYPCHGS